MTLVELTIALGVLTVAVGCLVEVLMAVNIGQERLSNRQQALETARNIAERVIGCDGDWQALCTEYNSESGVDVAVQDGDGAPNSGWARISVHVQTPSLSGEAAGKVTLVFGRAAH